MQTLFVIFAASGSSDGGGSWIGLVFGGCCGLFELLLIVLQIAGLWAVFAKAGKPGWAAIVPIYNGMVALEIGGKPIWWLVFFIVPCLWPVGWVMGILLSIEIAKAFGKDLMYGLGLAFLPFIFFPLLGFGSASYVGVPPPA